MRVAHLYRHPIKAHGFESLSEVTLTAGETMPLDRRWAVVEEGRDVDGSEWVSCRNFTRGAKAPSLMAIRCETNGDHITLRHPDRPELTLNPDTQGQALVDWSAPLIPETRQAPAKVVRAKGQGMTDAAMPFLSILGMSSLRALSQKVGQELSPLRFRGNIWLDDLGPWEEFEWIGKRLQIGGATIEIAERITRCRATEANPETGRRDAATLDALEGGWGHQDFGVYGWVVKGGDVAVADEARAL